jgi:hypothetical protein
MKAKNNNAAKLGSGAALEVRTGCDSNADILAHRFPPFNGRGHER